MRDLTGARGPGDLGMTWHSDSGVAIQRRIQKAAGPFAVLRCVAIEQHRRMETIDFGYFEAMGKGLSLPHCDLKMVPRSFPLTCRCRGDTCDRLRKAEANYLGEGESNLKCQNDISDEVINSAFCLYLCHSDGRRMCCCISFVQFLRHDFVDV
jgi:hypothetical protein